MLLRNKCCFVFILAFGISCSTAQDSDIRTVRAPSNALMDRSMKKGRIDFANFTFPAIKDWQAFSLVDGKSVPTRGADGKVDEMGYSLAAQSATDEPWAFVVVKVETGGSAIVHLVYFFDLSEDRPKLEWSFVSGDRASGGLRNIYREGIDLVIETYESRDSRGDCCPITFERSVYSIENHAPRFIKKTTGIANPERNAAFLGGPPK